MNNVNAHIRLIAAGLLKPDDPAEGTATIRDPAARRQSIGLVSASGRRS